MTLAEILQAVLIGLAIGALPSIPILIMHFDKMRQIEAEHNIRMETLKREKPIWATKKWHK